MILRKFAIALIALVLLGCFAKVPFAITDHSSKSYEQRDRTISTSYNRASNQTINGDQYDDLNGLYIDLSYNAAAKDSFVTLSVTDRFNTLVRGHTFYDPMREISLLVNDETMIVIALENGSKSYQSTDCDSEVGCSSDFSERAHGLLSLGDLAQLAQAKTVGIRVVGDQLERSYKPSAIEADFILHIEQFFSAVKAVK